jgi:hypothetical protein
MYLDVEASYISPPGGGVADLSNWEGQVRDALAVPYDDIYLAADDGSPTASRLTNPASISGVVVSDGPHFPERTTPEWVRVRTVRFTGVAEYVFRGAENALVSFAQTISITGNGGPMRRWRIPVNEYDPIRQRVSKGSIVRLVQSGAAIGHLGYPDPPAPLWDRDLLVNEAEAVTKEVGKPIGKAWVENVTRWNYIFENNKPLNAAIPLLPVM